MIKSHERMYGVYSTMGWKVASNYILVIVRTVLRTEYNTIRILYMQSTGLQTHIRYKLEGIWTFLIITRFTCTPYGYLYHKRLSVCTVCVAVLDISKVQPQLS